jgi:methionyl-tRNA formyltransferase
MRLNRNTFPSIVFVGAHQEARAPFQRLMERGENILGLVTLEPKSLAKMSGGADLAGIAEEAGIPTLRVRSVNEPAAVAWITERGPDLLLVVGWTQLLNSVLLRAPKIACLGFHASLLPKYRGRAPVNWAIINGETVTGNTMITLEPEADTGDIVAQRTIPITDEDDCNTIYEKVGATEVEMLEEILPMIRRGVLPRRKQDDSHATVMPKRQREDGAIDWNRSTREIYNWVRALTHPYPGAFSTVDGARVWVWKVRMQGSPEQLGDGEPGEVALDSDGWPWVATADGWIGLLSVQKEGGASVSGQLAAKTFLLAGRAFSEMKELVK